MPAPSFSDAIDRAVDTYVATVHAMTALNTASSLPASMLRRLGVLEQHASRTETATTRMFRELEPVRSAIGPGSGPIDPSDLDRAAADAWSRWLDDHGHRGIYESDLSRPRYVEDPSPILATLRSVPPARVLPRRTAAGVLTWPVWAIARRPIVAREEFRSDAMRVFLAVRRDLLRLADEAGIDPDDLWLLDTAEVRRLDSGWRPDESLLHERRADHARRRAHPIPEVIHRFDPAPAVDAGDGDRSEFSGIGLVAAEVDGVAWVLDEPAHELPEGFDRATTVLVAPSVDPGWISTFSLVAGVAIELGGDLSHGSILLRELGLPAVTNLRGLTAAVATGDRLHVDGRRGTVRIER
jgi:phosphohistidine swiveling domain-containing protein